jgi:hypothetical protein
MKIKDFAWKMKNGLESKGFNVPFSMLLEMISQAQGHHNWRTANAIAPEIVITEENTEELFIFIKLAFSFDLVNNKYDGNQTIALYEADALTRGYTWFTTQSLYQGMSKKQTQRFNDAIAQGKKVTLLFGIGEHAGGTNEISYQAEVMEVVSYNIPTIIPSEQNNQPSIWRTIPAMIWIKIRNIKLETSLLANQFEIISTGANLKEVISKSQFHFGYVKKA